MYKQHAISRLFEVQSQSMKNQKIFTISLYLLLSSAAFAAEIPFTIFHTNDLHSHFDGVKVPVGTSFEKRGGFARLTTLISDLKKKKSNEVIFGVDAGDFFAGTIFSGIALSKDPSFPEYQFFIENQYSLITLGNHEFDAQNDGLEIMLSKADKYKIDFPIIATNLYVTHGSPIKKYLGEDKLIRPYLIREMKSKNGNLRVGFLGILGPDGCLVSRSTRGDVHFLGFNDEKSKEDMDELVLLLNTTIENLKNLKKVDVVILSMHGGGKESHKLASRLKGLDVLISGHTHKQEFAIVNNVIINQTGSYGENLGVLELMFNKEKKQVKLKDPKNSHVITVSDKITEDLTWKKRIENWRKKSFQLMNEKSNPDEIVFTPKNSYIRSSKIPNPMGELVTKSILTQLNHNLPLNDKVDAYITSMGLVRTSFHKNTPYSRAEIFEAVSIGFDSKKVPGVDVVSFYLTPKEVKLIIGFMEIYTFISTSFSPAISPNLSFKIRKWGIPFINRIHDITLNGKPLSQYERNIKIATNRFVVLNIETVRKISRGWVDLNPKNEKGESTDNYPIHPKEYALMTEHFLANPNLY